MNSTKKITQIWEKTIDLEDNWQAEIWRDKENYYADVHDDKDLLVGVTAGYPFRSQAMIAARELQHQALRGIEQLRQRGIIQ